MQDKEPKKTKKRKKEGGISYAYHRRKNYIHVPAQPGRQYPGICIGDHRRVFWNPWNQNRRGREHGLFVSMPSRKTTDGYKDICFPVTAEFREQLHESILNAYHQALEQSVAQQVSNARPEVDTPVQAVGQQEPQM